jgi:hypothetical protein
MEVGKAVSDAASDVSQAVIYCQNSSDVTQCVLDVIDVAKYVDEIVGDIEAAVRDCRSTSAFTSSTIAGGRRRHSSAIIPVDQGRIRRRHHRA